MALAQDTLGKSVLITGCSSGIGLASVRMLKARGWQVLATARTPDDLERLERVEGVTAIPLELRDPASVSFCARAALELTSGKLTALFNNAAYGQPGAVEDLPGAVLRDQFEVNLFAWHDLTRALIPAMRRQGHGRIVQCSSVLGLVSAPWRGAYCASKFALEALSDALRMELSGSGVCVSIIEPGPISSRFLDHAIAAFKAKIDVTGSVHCEAYQRRLAGMEAGGRITFKLEPEAVAAKLVHALEHPRPKVRYYVTTPTHLAAGLKRLLPHRLMDRFAVRI